MLYYGRFTCDLPTSTLIPTPTPLLNLERIKTDSHHLYIAHQVNEAVMFARTLPIALLITCTVSLQATRSNVFLSRTPSSSYSFVRSLRHASATALCDKSPSSSVADLRKEYSAQGLTESDLTALGATSNPYKLFENWFNEACTANVLEPNAMCLSTCIDNKPSGRFVLLKAHDERGFVWYTNYNSRKGNEIGDNPNAALTFWWGDLERSIRIEGTVEKVSDEEADTYFHSRPRGSQLGAWTSNQSSSINNREELEAQEVEIKKRFDNVDVIPRPPHWGGFRLKPSRIEFWKGRSSRLHDRLVFSKEIVESTEWALKRLQP